MIFFVVGHVCCCWPSLLLLAKFVIVGQVCCCWPSLLLLAKFVVVGQVCYCWPSLLLLAKFVLVGQVCCQWRRYECSTKEERFYSSCRFFFFEKNRVCMYTCVDAITSTTSAAATSTPAKIKFARSKRPLPLGTDLREDGVWGEVGFNGKKAERRRLNVLSMACLHLETIGGCQTKRKKLKNNNNNK